MSRQYAIKPVRVALLGASGRMGRCLLCAIHESTDFELVGAQVSQGSPAVGTDASALAGVDRDFGVRVCAQYDVALEHADVVLDFSVAQATPFHIKACVERGLALVVGTTGLGAGTIEQIAQAAQQIPVLLAANTSLGVNVLLALIEQAARALPPEYDIEILDMHHRYKVDAPSGTALALGAAAAAGRGRSLSELSDGIRGAQTGARAPGSIGFAVVRSGDVAGEHTVYLSGPGERLELTHRAHDRMTFAYGALRAGAWLRTRAAGQYAMADVLG